MHRCYLFAKLTQQSLVLGASAGAACGGIYGGLLPWFDLLRSRFLNNGAPIRLFEIPSVLIVMLMLTVSWLILGGVIGGLFGIAFGLLNGILVGSYMITVSAFQVDLRLYHWSGISLLATAFGAYLVIHTIGDGLDQMHEWVFVGIPTLCVFPSACWASRRLATWYSAYIQAVNRETETADGLAARTRTGTDIDRSGR